MRDTQAATASPRCGGRLAISVEGGDYAFYATRPLVPRRARQRQKEKACEHLADIGGTGRPGACTGYRAARQEGEGDAPQQAPPRPARGLARRPEIGRASCRERA